MGNYYDNYTNSTLAMGNNTSDQFINLSQLYLNQTFNNAPDYVLTTYTKNGSTSTQIDTRVLSAAGKVDSKPLDESRHIIMRDLSLEVNYGDMMNFRNNDWIIIDKNDNSNASNTCEVEKCNETLKCILPNGKLIDYPCILSAVSKKSMTVEKDGTTMESEKMPFLITVPNNQDILDIPPSYRLLLGRLAYRTTDFDDVSSKGLIIILLTTDQNRPTDDFANQLADNEILQIPIITGSLIISGLDKITTGTSQPYKIVYDNGNDVIGMEFIFTVSSTNAIITVVDELNISIFGETSSQFLLTGTCGTTVLTKIISIANSF
jgi:hypothetical protein